MRRPRHTYNTSINQLLRPDPAINLFIFALHVGNHATNEPADTAAEERTDDEDCNGKQELAGHVKRTLRTNYSLLKTPRTTRGSNFRPTLPALRAFYSRNFFS